MLEDKIIEARKIAKEASIACVAFTEADGYHIYAINGENESLHNSFSTEIQAIEGLLLNPKRADINNSFTKFESLKNYKRFSFIYNFEDYVYEKLSKEGFAEFLYDSSFYKIIKYYDKSFDKRIFNCAERKILGYIIDNSISKHGPVYVDLNPCLLCLLLIDEGYYIDRKDEKIKHFIVYRNETLNPIPFHIKLIK